MRRAREQDKGKAKVQEEQIFQDMPEFELPQETLEPQTLDTTRLTVEISSSSPDISPG